MPLPQGYTVEAKKRTKFHPLPLDKYQVQITDINLLEDVLNTFSGKRQDYLNFEFTVLDDKNFDYVDEEGEKQIESVRGRKLWKRIAPSNSPAGKKSKASWLFKILCAVEGKELSEEELAPLQPADLIGQQVMVIAEPTESGFNNINAFSPIKEELKPVEPKEGTIDEELLEEEIGPEPKQITLEEVTPEEKKVVEQISEGVSEAHAQKAEEAPPEPVKKKFQIGSKH